MSKHNLNSSTKDHGLYFHIEGARITVDEMGKWAADIVRWPSEAVMEDFAHDVTHAIFIGVAGKVRMAKADQERARVHRLWVKLHPPNHAGYYYCHIGGEWVHQDGAELDHIVPSSVQKINTDIPGWDEKLRMSCHDHNFQKGSSIVKSVTLEIAPPDGEA